MPTISSYNIRKPVHNRCFGIEIECLLDTDAARKAWDNFHGFFYAGRDGSIRDTRYSEGVEFVSQPLPYKWLRKEIGKLYKKHQWRENDSCGIHIHVSRAGLSMKQINKLRRALVGYTNDHLRALFGRGVSTYNNPNRNDRYCSVNIENDNTIEFRMFKSGDADWAKECLRRTKLMVEHKGSYDYLTLRKLFGLEQPAAAQTSLGYLLRRHMAS